MGHASENASGTINRLCVLLCCRSRANISHQVPYSAISHTHTHIECIISENFCICRKEISQFCIFANKEDKNDRKLPTAPCITRLVRR